MKFLINVVFIFFAMNVYSEPSKSFRYLMDEPLTMLEWGLFKLDKHTDKIVFKELDLINNYSNVSYDWDKSRLKIEFIIYPKYKNIKIQSVKSICKKVTSQIRSEFGTKYEKDIRPLLSVSKYFEHDGFINSTRPNNLMEEIENSTEIEVKIYSSKYDSAPYNLSSTCRSPLMGAEILFVEN